MSTLEDIIKIYNNKSADEIATIIKNRHIKGRMGTTYGCPMALLLNTTSTGSYIIGRKYIVRRSGTKIEKVRTPRQMSVFIRKFDIGKYPNLIMPPPRCVNKNKPKVRIKNTSGSPKHIIKNHIKKLVDRFSKG